MMNNLRKVLYMFDMTVYGFFLFGINRTMFIESHLIHGILNISLLLRLFIPILLYRRERVAIFPLTTFVLLFGIVIFANTFQNFIINMGKFVESFIRIGQDSMLFDSPFWDETLIRCIICWVWLTPLAVYIVQYITKQTTYNGYPWYYMIGVIVFKDSVGKLFLSTILPLFIAFIVGYEMIERLSFFALISLPLVGYYFWNKHLGRYASWIEYALLIVALYLYDKAQYSVDGARIAYLTLSAGIIFIVSCWMFHKSRNFMVSLLAFLMAAFILPTASLGYNVYNGIEGKRYTNYDTDNHKGYMYIKRTEVVNGIKTTLVGIRNRYHTTIPCEYKYIRSKNRFIPFVKCVKDNNDFVISNIENGNLMISDRQ